MNVLGLITARGGSKRYPGKNIHPVCGLPLIAWTIRAAQNSTYLDKLVLSSDDEQIIAVARDYGCDVPFVRPAELATDTASSADVVLHALECIEQQFDLLVLLQPTSPLRNAEDIDSAINLVLSDEGVSSVVSVSRVNKHPSWMYSLSTDNHLTPFLTPDSGDTGTLQAAYVPNGAVYVVKPAHFRQCPKFIDEQSKAYIMPAERSVDIDTRDEMEWFEWYCEKNIAQLAALEQK